MLQNLSHGTLGLRALHTYLTRAPSERVRLVVLGKIVTFKDGRSFELFLKQVDDPSPESSPTTALGPGPRARPHRSGARHRAAGGLGAAEKVVRPGARGDRRQDPPVLRGQPRRAAGEYTDAIRWLGERAGEDLEALPDPL